MEHLFKSWDKIKKEILKAGHIFLLFDYDGTLTPIVETPDKAVISNQTKELLKIFTKVNKFKLAIISGRALKDIKRLVGIDKIIYAGNHGLEIEGEKIKFESPISVRSRDTIKKIKEDLEERFSKIRGLFVEDKGITLSVHYRLVDREDILQVKNIFDEITRPYLLRNRIRIRPAKKVFEIRPPVNWDKGKVVLWLLARQKFALKDESILPIYIGDDLTDEDAFKVLKNKGLTIFVGKPTDSYARYYLNDTKEVFNFLRRILCLNR